MKLANFNVFKSVLNDGGIVKAIVCPNADNYSRKVIDELTYHMKRFYLLYRGSSKLVNEKLLMLKKDMNRVDGGETEALKQQNNVVVLLQQYRCLDPPWKAPSNRSGLYLCAYFFVHLL